MLRGRLQMRRGGTRNAAEGAEPGVLAGDAPSCCSLESLGGSRTMGLLFLLSILFLSTYSISMCRKVLGLYVYSLLNFHKENKHVIHNSSKNKKRDPHQNEPEPPSFSL